MTKLYVREWTEETVDEDKLQVIEVCESKLEGTTFLIFIEK
ncbi:hypothetical protein [Mesobacillus zeae]|nr:hypothetical protein [Mesobacillus zeae]